MNQYIDEFNTYFANEDPYIGYTAQGISYSTDGEAIMSRFPILDSVQIPIVTLDSSSSYDVTHDFMSWHVNISGTEMYLIGAHLKAMSGADNEYRREREQEGIINYMDSLGEVPIMYMGDLNSFSPDDTGDLAPKGDLGYGPMTMMLYPEDPIYGQYSSVNHNFTDVFRTLNPSDPGYTYGHQNPTYESRIDFIVVNDYLSDYLVNSTIGDTPSADTGSDHYCVDFFLDISAFQNQTDVTAPGKVQGVYAEAVNGSTINLSWNPNTEDDLDHYNIYRNGTKIAETKNTSYSDGGLNVSAWYSYEISAVDTSGNEGEKSDVVIVKTKDEVVIPEIHPFNVQLTLYLVTGIALVMIKFVGRKYFKKSRK
ncbi:MAG: fibronectin type III domain-containing protein [Candidatus Heimdallarchaeaceae archaeon]